MAFVNPSSVTAPKANWVLSNVLFSSGQGGWSAAEGEWDGDACLAIRWNGSDATEGVGNPQSRGHPTWFIVPRDLGRVLRQEIEQLVKTSSVVICSIFQPSNYQVGAWRIEAELAGHVLSNLNGSDLLFALPQLSARLCIPEKGYFQPGQDGVFGAFVSGKWCGDLYSNGVGEADNPVSVAVFRDSFISNVTQAVQRFGSSDV